MSRYTERLNNVTEEDVEGRVEQFKRPLAHVAAAASGRSLEQMPASDIELAWAVCLTDMVDVEMVVGLDKEQVKPMLRGVYNYYQNHAQSDRTTTIVDSPEQRWEHLMERYQEKAQQHRRCQARRKIGRQSWDELQDYVAQERSTD